ncbi:hypothetical protein Taro_048039 [Colocasia esculenta]|uniref:Uncharacterized protein n=1 Tax=Colocasia esculenta TaxID=4460 RepID=A0A843WUN6_COLES|nr:hypothetical protein [Colocasia esculenta]
MSFSHGCLVSLGMTLGCSFPTSWRSGMFGACVVRLWSHVVAPVFRELLCLGGCVPRVCFRIVFDSAGSAGVVFGLTRFCFRLLEFLLLWLVLPEFFSVGSSGELLVVVLVRFALRTNGALVVLVEVLPKPVVLLPGTPCIPMVVCFASFLAPCVLSQTVV